MYIHTHTIYIYIYIYIFTGHWHNGQSVRQWPGSLGSIPGRVIPKTLKIVLDVSLLNTQHYKVRIKGKVEKFWERSSALPYTLVQQLSKREPSGHPRLWSPTLLIYIYIYPLLYINLRTIVLPRVFCTYSFGDSTDKQNL